MIPASSPVSRDRRHLLLTLPVLIVHQMRRATSVILGLLLILGSSLAGPGHVHAASKNEESGGLHVDHIHLESDHNQPPIHMAFPLEIAVDHPGDDAVTLIGAGSEAMPKRELPYFAESSFSCEAPEIPRTENHDRPGALPRDPPHHTGPPGRAPPA